MNFSTETGTHCSHIKEKLSLQEAKLNFQATEAEAMQKTKAGGVGHAKQNKKNFILFDSRNNYELAIATGVPRLLSELPAEL